MNTNVIEPIAKDVPRRRKVYAVGKHALSSEPIYKSIRAIDPSKRKRSKVTRFLLGDVTRYFS